MQQPKPNSIANASARRGNTIVLVTSILVLLVIVATAFVGRTRAVRQISAAQQQAAGRDGRAESIGVNVAQEISGALFAKPVNTADPYADPDGTGLVIASSSWPRLAPALDAPRYSIDRDGGNGFPLFGYNYAPYETKAWTNWPDQFGGASPWPFGPGAPGGIVTTDANPYGNPGTADSRWLRSTEPVRVGIDEDTDGTQDLFTFSHWQHLSWLPTANNGWRVVPDISNIAANTLENIDETAIGVPFALAIPYEQWLPTVFPNALAGPNPANAINDFINRREIWFGAVNGANSYITAYRDPALALPNFFRLRDLGRPTDEFKPNTLRNVVSRTFTDADGDGFTDSFWFAAPVSVDRGVRTIVGVSVVDNSSKLNANVATKFSFGYDADPSVGLTEPIPGTAGHTPSDLALVTSNAEFSFGPTHGRGNTVGFLDGPVNQSSGNTTGGFPLPTYWSGSDNIGFVDSLLRFNRERFGDRLNGAGQQINAPSSFLQATGMITAVGGRDGGNPTLGYPLSDNTLQPNLQGSFESPRERIAYFKIAGLDPEKPLFGLIPFDAADEFELRAYHGNNMPFSLSRFEQALSFYSPSLQGPPDDGPNASQFLRASPMREESDEYLDQLDARQLLVDTRRKLTMFNGARNDVMPPSLWLRPYYSATFNYMNPGGTVPAVSSPDWLGFQQANRAEFERQKLKIDLRAPMFVNDAGQAVLTRNPFRALQWRRDLGRVIENSLARAIDSDGNGDADTWQSYFGTREADYQRTLSMVASYVANLDTASDEASTGGASGTTPGVALDRPLYPNAPFQDPAGYFPAQTDVVIDPNDADRFYTGMEKQPFIMEVFMGLAYPSSDFNDAEWTIQGGTPPPAGQEELPPDVDDGGEKFVDSTSVPSLIVAVQVANPYDTPVSLLDYRLQLFGQNFSFATGVTAGVGGGAPYPGVEIVLPPATLGRPSTAIVYAVIDGAFGDFPATDTDGNPATAPTFRQAVLDFLDLERGEMQGSSFQPNTDADGDGVVEYANLYDTRGLEPDVDEQDRTLVFNATGVWKANLSTGLSPYTNGTTQPVQLLRNVMPPPGIPGGPVLVVVDRFDNEETGPEVKFNEAFQRLLSDPQHVPPQKNYNWDADPDRRFVAGIRLKDNDFFMTWCRASRIWAFDVDTWDDAAVDLASKRISATELSPRYVFSMATEPVRTTRQLDGVDTNGARRNGADAYKGEMWKIDQDPDGDLNGQNRWANMVWVDMFGRTLRSKPVFFSNLTVLRVGGTEVITNPGSGPMPFLPALGLPDAPADIYVQDCHGAVTYQGVNYEWMIGNKGCSAADWQRFSQVPVATIPFQMTQKDSDFEQIGEILDVFLWGHVYENFASPSAVRTFSEIMLEDDPDDEFFPGTGLFVNRLQIRLPQDLAEDDPGSVVLGARFDPSSIAVPPPAIAGFVPWQPALPTGVAIFDALTIDGPGRNSFDRNGNSLLSPGLTSDPTLLEPAGPNQLYDLQVAQERQFRLAHAFSGRKTSGLVNLNTAMPEVLQALPMMTRVPKNSAPPPLSLSPYSHFADMIRSYRDGIGISLIPGNATYGAPSPVVNAAVPNYVDRGLTEAQFGVTDPTFFAGMRRENGFASIGELYLLQRVPPDTVAPHLRTSYSSRWLGIDPYAGLVDNFKEFDVGYSWSTDRTNPRPRQLPADVLFGLGLNTDVPTKPHDEPLGDAEDMNLLFKGISNLVTTRSDVFTVYLRVRQVRQNPVTGVWDGTNPELIVDESRYVMCVDRSEVNSPSDQPRIVYFQKCPN
jgi:hypothetical protein